MPSSTFQPSFAAGVLAPSVQGRVDINRYDIGLKTGRNVIIHPHGGVSNRAGTEFIGAVGDESKTGRMIPFLRDDSSNYMLLFQENTMRVVRNGAFVQDGGAPFELATPIGAASILTMDYAQSVDVMILANTTFFPKRLEHTNATTWSIQNIPINPTAPAPDVTNVTSENTGTETYRYAVTAVIDGIEGFRGDPVTIANAASLSLQGEKNTISFSTVPGADEYRIYREKSGVYRYIGYANESPFVDDNILPGADNPPVPSTVFNTTARQPDVVAFFQQRLIFGGSNANPETIIGSRIGDFYNFTRARTLRPDDRLELQLAGGSLNSVRALLPLRELLAFTSSAEFSIVGPDGGLPADNAIQNQFGYSGSTDVKPLVVEDTALFVDRTGRNIRDLRYSFEQDGYAGNDLTIFAQHYFDGRQVVHWAFAKNPDSIVWVVLDDGTLLSFTYKREHQVWAWTDQDVGGFVEDVSVVPEGGLDAVYLLVRRTINGATRRYIERLHKRRFDDLEDAFFVDCGLTYEGAPATVISGLGHLNGEKVVALADGSVVTGLTVSGGSITLPSAASKVHVGLPFTSEIETLPPALNLEGVGIARGRQHKVSKMRIHVEKTRGIQAASATQRFNEVLQPRADLSQPGEAITGMVDITLYADWNKDGSVRIRQKYPLPMSILALAPEMSVGRD